MPHNPTPTIAASAQYIGALVARLGKFIGDRGPLVIFSGTLAIIAWALLSVVIFVKAGASHAAPGLPP